MSRKTAVVAPAEGARGSKGDRTRKQIKAALVELLGSKSVDDIVLNDICQATGLTVGAFYFHFRNKQALLEEVAVDAINAYFLEVSSVSASSDVKGGIAALAGTYIRLCRERPGMMRLLFQLVPRPGRARDAWWKHHVEMCNEVASKIAALRGRNGRQRTRDEIEVQLLVLGTEAFVQHLLNDREPGATLLRERPQELKAELLAIWSRALGLHF